MTVNMLQPKILVVDDNPDVLAITTEMLKGSQFQILKAHSAKECLISAKLEKPDLILLDVVMPEMTGIEVCGIIKSNPEFTDTSVILVTGLQNEEESRISGLETGADDYLRRPFSKRELIARINSSLKFYRLEKNKRQLEINYRKLLDLSRDGIITIDLDGRILTHNAYALQLFKQKSDDLIGSAINDFIHPESSEVWNKFHNLLMHNITPPFVVLTMKVRNKNLRVEIISSPLVEGVKVTGALCIIRENPARKKDNTESDKNSVDDSEKRENDFLEMISGQPTRHTAEIYNSTLIKDGYPEIFSRIKDKYKEAIGIMIENRIYKQEKSHKMKLLEISAELGYMKAEPRDLIIMHRDTVKELSVNVPERKKNLIKDEGRIALIELMGYLLSYYRNLNS